MEDDTSFDGTLKGGFTGEIGEALVTGFQFIDENSKSLNGAALFTISPELSPVEAASLDKVGFALFAQQPNITPSFWEQRGLIGAATNGDPGNPLIVEYRSGSDPESDNAAFPNVSSSNNHYHLTRSNGYEDSSPMTGVGGILGLSWGSWGSSEAGGPIFLESATLDYSSSGDSATANNEVLFATGNEISDITSSSAVFTYPSVAEKRWQFSNDTAGSLPLRIVSSDSNLNSFYVDSLLEFDFATGDIFGYLDVFGCVSSISCDSGDAVLEWTSDFSKTNDFSSDGLFRISVFGDFDNGSVDEAVEGEIYGFFTEDSSIDAVPSIGFSFGGEGTSSEPDYPSTGDFIAGLALFEEVDLLNTSDIQAVSDSDNFGLILIPNGIDGDCECGFSSPIWGWTNGSESKPVLLTDFSYQNGSNRLDDLADIYDPSVTTPVKFDRGFQLDTSSSSAQFAGSGDTDLAAFGVQWGLWDGSEQELQIFDKIGLINDVDHYDTAELTFYLSAPPAYTGASLSGSVNFDNVSSFIGVRDDGAAVSDVVGGFDLDLTSGDVTNGTLTVCFGAATCATAGAQQWEIGGFSKVGVAGAGIGIIEEESVVGQISVDGTDISTPNFSGDIYGYFLDNGTQPGFVLGFDLENDSGSAIAGSGSLLGGALLTGSYLSDLNYDGAFQSNVYDFGFVVVPDQADGIIGNATSFGDPTVITFAGTGGQTGSNELYSANPDLIFIADEEFEDSVTAISNGYQVDWLQWNDDTYITTYTDAGTSAIEGDLGGKPAYLMSTSYYTALTTGKYTFANTTAVNEFQGFSSNVDVDDITGSFDVDFSTGALINGNLQIFLPDSGESGFDQTWFIDFSGTFKTLTDEFSADIVTYLDAVTIDDSFIQDDFDGTATGNEIDGEILGLLMFSSESSTSKAFSGGFSLHEVGNSSNNVYGGFIWGADSFLTAEERLGLNGAENVGIFVTGSPKTGDTSGIFGGPAFDTGTAGEELFTARVFDESTFDNDYDITTEGIFRNISASVDNNTSGTLSGAGIDRWGFWRGTVGSTFFEQQQQSPNGGIGSDIDSTNGYWFVAEPLAAGSVPSSGEFRYGDQGVGLGSNILSLRGSYGFSTAGTADPTYTNIDAISTSLFEFDIDFSNGTITNGQLEMSAGGVSNVEWKADFDGSLLGSKIFATVNNNNATNFVKISGVNIGGSLEGQIQGFFTGNTGIDGVALAFDLTNNSDTNGDNHSLFGTIALDDDATDLNSEFSTPEPTIDEFDVSWGKWDNPVDENWVVVTPETNGQVGIETQNHMAMVTPTPVANLTGSADYASTISSAFVGAGSAGEVTQVVAGMSVDFDTGTIMDGSLQVEVANSQAWEIDFAGTINAGQVDLNSLGGTLMDPGGLISNSIDANLGGVFTGNAAEAFVGGFDLVDQVNALNHVDGLYTIER